MPNNPAPNPPPSILSGELWTYGRIRQLFGWASSSPIRRYVREGKLIRVRTSASLRDFKIDAASAIALLESMRNELETFKFFEKSAADMRSLKRARTNRVPKETTSAAGSNAGLDHAIRQQAPVREQKPAPMTLDEAIAARGPITR